MKIGYVGLGAMGGALAKWLVEEHSLLVWDLNPAAMERFVALGGTAATSMAQLARDSDVIVTCLPRSAEVEQALFGDAGLAAGLSAGKLVIDQTSGVPDETRRLAARLEAMGVAMLDAPVAGGVPAAAAGRVTIIVSGPDHAQNRAAPVFEAMTSKIYRAGARVGDAQAVKTLNNMLNMINRLSTLELAALGIRLGAPLPMLTDRLNAGLGANFATRTLLPAIVEGRSSGSFALALMLKDNNQAISLGTEMGLPMPLSSLARGILQQNINIIGPEAGLDDIVVFMARTTGVGFGQDTGREADAVEAEAAARLIATALAACNRAGAYEIMSLAARLHLDIAEFGEIINNASSWSRACEDILAERQGAAAHPPGRLADTVAAFQTIERRGVATGVANLISGTVRALCEAALQEVGPDATVTALAAHDRMQRSSAVGLSARSRENPLQQDPAPRAGPAED